MGNDQVGGVRIETVDAGKPGIGPLAHDFAIRTRACNSARVSSRLGRFPPGVRYNHFLAMPPLLEQWR